MKNYRLMLFTVLLLLVTGTVCGAITDSEVRAISKANQTYKQKLYDDMLKYISSDPRSEEFERIDDTFFMLGELSAELYPTEFETPLKYYRKVLEINPNYPMKDAVLYNIAMLKTDLQKRARDEARQKRVAKLIEENKFEAILRWEGEERLTEESLQEVTSAYNELLTQYPESNYYSESLFRYGVLLYDIGIDAEEPVLYYNKAKKIFDILANQPGDEFQHIGLYQRAWSYFSVNDFENAIIDFCSILDVIHEKTRFRAYFEQDAIENIAYSLVRMDGADYSKPSVSVRYARKQLPAQLDDEKVLLTILKRVIEIKKELNAPFHAIDYYELLIELLPCNLDNPSIIEEMITIYKSYGYMLSGDQELRERVITLKFRLYDNYNSKSQWYSTNKDKTDFAAQVAIIKDAFIFVEPILWNRFVIEQTVNNYNAYLSLLEEYKDFSEFNDEDGLKWYVSKMKNLVDANITLAEMEKRPGIYIQENAFVKKFNENYPENIDFRKYEMSRYGLMETYYDEFREIVKEKDYIDEADGTIITMQSLTNQYMNAVTEFLTIFFDQAKQVGENKNDVIGALYRRSLIYLSNNDYANAEADLLTILEFDIDSLLKRDVYIYLAQINEKYHNYPLAESYFRKAAEYATDKEDRENIKNHYRRQIQETALTLSKEESYSEAAEEFLRLADEFKGSDDDVVVGLQQQAIDAYIKSGEYQKAIDLLIDMTSIRTDENAVYFLYSSAWGIADSLMHSESKEMELKNEYIAKNPSSHNSFVVRYNIIEKVSKDQERKYEAGDLLFTLHNDVREKRIENKDYKVEDIYYDALNIYHDYPDREKVNELMLGFDKLYPNDPRANGLIELVAIYYDEQGRDKEFEDLAKYLYKKDPNSNLFENIARRKIKLIYDKATELFVAEQFQEMFAKIDEFTALDKAYQKDGITLPLQDFYYDFEAYKQSYENKKAFDAYVESVLREYEDAADRFLTSSANSLLRVNVNTKWQEHLGGGEMRIEGLVQKANKNRDSLISKIQESSKLDRDIPIELRTRGLYIIGNVYERFAEVTEEQLELFLTASGEMKEIKQYNLEEYNSACSYIRENYLEPYANFFKSEAVGWYNLILSSFAQNGYEDEYTHLAKEKLSELGPSTERISIFSNTEWLVSRVGNDENISWQKPVTLEERIDLSKIVGLNDSQSEPIWIDDPMSEEIGNKIVFQKQFNLDKEVADAFVTFVSYGASTIKINGEAIGHDLVAVQDPDEDILYPSGLEVTSKVFVNGLNTITIETEELEDQQGIIFELDLTVKR